MPTIRMASCLRFNRSRLLAGDSVPTAYKRIMHGWQPKQDLRLQRSQHSRPNCNTILTHAGNAATASPLPPSAPDTALPVTDASLAPAFYVNLDLKYVRDHVDELIVSCRQRNSDADPALVAELYDAFAALEREVEAVRKQRNDNAAGMKGKMDAEQRQQMIQHGKALKDQLSEMEARMQSSKDRLQVEAQRLPNLSHPSSPVGDEDEAAVLETVGKQRQMDFEVRDHVRLGTELGVIDFEAGAAVSGAKFAYLRGAGALLEVALVSWALQRVTAAGFMPHGTPDLVRSAILEKCGFQPRGTNTQVYSIKDSPLCLTGTAEVPLAGIHMDAILPAAQLPLRIAGYGRAFRTEAGAAGSASRGLYRLHQFSKVEMFVICTPEQSEDMFQELIDLERQLYSELGLHFKVLDMPTADLGAPAYRKVDFEAWMPGLQRYGEISSASNCTDYQARRLGIRYRPDPSKPLEENGEAKAKKPKKVATAYVHTLNATAAAVPRLIVAILENFQQADGSVIIPEVLRPFLGGQEVIEPEQNSC